MTGVRFFHAQNRATTVANTVQYWSGVLWNNSSTYITDGSGAGYPISSTALSSGQWYVEVVVSVTANRGFVGVVRSTSSSLLYPGVQGSQGVGFWSFGQYQDNVYRDTGTSTQTFSNDVSWDSTFSGSGWSTGRRVGLHIDATLGIVRCTVDGTNYSRWYSLVGSGAIYLAMGEGGYGTTFGATIQTTNTWALPSYVFLGVFPATGFEMDSSTSSGQGWTKTINSQTYFVQSVNTGGTRAESVGDEAWRAFILNESDSGQWTGAWNSGSSTVRLELHLPSAVRYSKVSIRPSSNTADGGGNNLVYPITFTISGSNDGVTWNQLTSQSLGVTQSGWARGAYRDFVFSANIASYTRYRMEVTASGYAGASYTNQTFGSLIYSA